MNKIIYEEEQGWLKININHTTINIYKDNIEELARLLRIANDKFSLDKNLDNNDLNEDNVSAFIELEDTTQKYNMSKLEKFFLVSSDKSDKYCEGGWIHFEDMTFVVSKAKRDREILHLTIDVLVKDNSIRNGLDNRIKSHSIELKFDINEIKEIKERSNDYYTNIEILKTDGNILKFSYEDYSD